MWAFLLGKGSKFKPLSGGQFLTRRVGVARISSFLESIMRNRFENICSFSCLDCKVFQVNYYLRFGVPVCLLTLEKTALPLQ